MSMRLPSKSRVKRWFTIKTRFEAFLVIYAIALGAVERGRVYIETYHGANGWILAAAATGVVFVGGAKLLDSVRPVPVPVPGPLPVRGAALTPARRVSRNRPRSRPYHSGSRSAISLRKD
jgi:hypothetical protein